VTAAALPASAQRVQAALAEMGFSNRVVVMPGTTRTAAEAADACGCTIAQIAKSIVFRAKASGRPVLVITSGGNRVGEKAVAAELGEKIGHSGAVEIFIDRDLMAFDEIWAAAGTPFAVFKLTPDELVTMTGGRVIAVT